jgi:riboflavin synthase
MFTGIVESASISQIKIDSDGWQIGVLTPSISAKVSNGDSVAIDGACLTVIDIQNNEIFFFVSTESISKTIINNYQVGTIVNIELPLQPTSFLGGHYVLGHVDDRAVVEKIEETDTAWFLTIVCAKAFCKYAVYKGSITINGVSLTINAVNDHFIELCIIPITLKKTNLSALKVGHLVNIEFDILAKYTEKLLQK